MTTRASFPEIMFPGFAVIEPGSERRRQRRDFAYWCVPSRLCRPASRQKTISMHVLRHSAAMRLLQAGIETLMIALWLGHEQVETTHIYLHADIGIKERALAATAPAVATPGRSRPNEKLLAFLEAL